MTGAGPGWGSGKGAGSRVESVREKRREGPAVPLGSGISATSGPCGVSRSTQAQTGVVKAR